MLPAMLRQRFLPPGLRRRLDPRRILQQRCDSPTDLLRRPEYDKLRIIEERADIRPIRLQKTRP